MNLENFETCISQGLSLDHIYLLYLSQNTDLSTLKSSKIVAIIKALQRKNLLTDKYQLTTEGKQFANMWNSENVIELKLVDSKIKDENFNKWWSVYPGTDTFEYKAQKFQGTRGLRVKKDECCIKFNKILSEGEYTVEQLIGALQYEIVQKKENSIKQRANKLSFMQNSLTYLNQRTFEPFIELINSSIGKQVVEQQRPTEVSI